MLLLSITITITREIGGKGRCRCCSGKGAEITVLVIVLEVVLDPGGREGRVVFVPLDFEGAFTGAGDAGVDSCICVGAGC